jgi:thiol:disulfide interchange protein DsbC
MKKRHLLSAVPLLAGVLLTQFACSEETALPGAQPSSETEHLQVKPSAAQADEKRFRQRLAAHPYFAGAPVKHIAPAALDGYWVVEIEGGMLLYVRDDIKYVLAGVLLEDDGQGQMTNHNDLFLASIYKAAFQELKPGHYISYRPEGTVKRVIYVFTDVHCPYCRAFHKEIPALNKAGVEVRYLAYPVISPRSPAHMTAIWCDGDPAAAMDRAKLKQKFSENSDCPDTAIKQGTHLAQKLGLNGTPAVYTDSAIQLGAYMKAEEILERLGLR